MLCLMKEEEKCIGRVTEDKTLSGLENIYRLGRRNQRMVVLRIFYSLSPAVSWLLIRISHKTLAIINIIKVIQPILKRSFEKMAFLVFSYTVSLQYRI